MLKIWVICDCIYSLSWLYGFSTRLCGVTIFFWTLKSASYCFLIWVKRQPLFILLWLTSMSHSRLLGSCFIQAVLFSAGSWAGQSGSPPVYLQHRAVLSWTLSTQPQWGDEQKSKWMGSARWFIWPIIISPPLRKVIHTSLSLLYTSLNFFYMYQYIFIFIKMGIRLYILFCNFIYSFNSISYTSVHNTI